MEQQHHMPMDALGDRFGMWLFLLSEILLFGVLFIIYSVYLAKNPADFEAGSHMLDVVFGTVNTLILLVSSFFVAASITAVQRGRRRTAMAYLVGTIAIALVFLVNKYFEWGHKFHLDIYPGSEWLTSQPHGMNLFFGLYYVTTGLHGLHVIIGGTLISIALYLVYRGKITSERFTFLENAGLYWHLVDLIWIFVFPLYYLAR